MSNKLQKILKQSETLHWQDKLLLAVENFNNPTFSTSFSLEDQVITDFIARNQVPIEIFTIDTGRLPQETYNVWQATLDKYAITIKGYSPKHGPLENFTKEHGINPFYESKDLRLTCCAVRKIEPLHRALKNKDLWISGLRKAHSSNRNEKAYFENDDNLKLTKFYPLLDLSESELWEAINQKGIPFNRLYKSGYRSIGCAPCSRAIGEGDDIRAGRWWWEDDSKKECGLHA